MSVLKFGTKSNHLILTMYRTFFNFRKWEFIFISLSLSTENGEKAKQSSINTVLKGNIYDMGYQ